MAAGIPGVGINGVFYTLLVALAPLRELPRTLAGRSSVGRWRSIARLFTMTAAVIVVLAGEYWLFAKAADYARSHWGATSEDLAHSFDSVAPRLAAAPFYILGVVLGSMHLVRFTLWLRTAIGVRGRTAALMVLAAVGSAVYLGACAYSRWNAVHQPEGYDFSGANPSVAAEYESLDEFYKRYDGELAAAKSDDSYGAALAQQTLGLMRGDASAVARARDAYAKARDAATDPRQKEMAALGAKYAGRLLSGDATPAPAEAKAPEPIVYARVERPAPGFRRIVLGRTAVRVRHGALVKTQADRVTRDWLLAHNAAGSPWNYAADTHVTWHEGEKTRELAEYAGARIVPVWGTKATRIGDTWYAPDDKGAPRFEISEDKVVNYPTTIVVDSHTALVNDTHGISAVAWDATDADLVVGCGDHQGKMDAAYWLAERGVNVYVPTDRLIGTMIGVKTKGSIIGSAPVKRSGDGAVIGDQPITIEVDEPIVVSTAVGAYPLRYYDAPKRYFEALGEWCGKKLNVTAVEVKEYGHATNVVEEARKLGAKVLGIRVKSAREHDAVAAWLKEDPARRAVLFHTAVYPDGYRLFAEFPRQTSFGDTQPVFE